MQNLNAPAPIRTGPGPGRDRGHPVGRVAELGERRDMIPLDRLVREPSDLAVAASFRRLNEAIHSHDQARIDLVLAEISGLAARRTPRGRFSQGKRRGRHFVCRRLWRDAGDEQAQHPTPGDQSGLARLMATDGMHFRATPTGPAWLADNREIVRLLRLAFPGVQAHGSGLEHGQVVGRAAGWTRQQTYKVVFHPPG